MAGEYDKVDAAKDTDTSSGQVSSAWHDARADAEVHSGKDVDHFKSAPSWTEGKDTTDSGFSLFPESKRVHSSSNDSDESSK